MIYKLEQTAYQKAATVFSARALHLEIDAVLRGDCPGTVYADDPSDPRAACIASGDGYYLDGAVDNGAFRSSLNALLPRDSYFALYCDLGRWGKVLDSLLAHTYAVPAQRSYLVLREPAMPDWPDRVPEGFHVNPIDDQLLSSGWQGVEDLREGIQETWRSVEVFLEKGFGFCVVHDGVVVSRCNADFCVGDRCEIGVSTAWSYRRQGLATLAAAATVSHAVSRGLTVGWHCWANNVGSIGVAKNVGFELARPYEIRFSHWAAENISDMTPAEFRDFARTYERLFKLDPPESGYPHIVAAKAWSLGGEVTGCFRQLARAVDLGWLHSVDRLREVWPEFFSIQHLDQTDEWAALARRIE